MRNNNRKINNTVAGAMNGNGHNALRYVNTVQRPAATARNTREGSMVP